MAVVRRQYFAMGNGTSSLVVKMQITPALLATGMVWAVTVGFFGGLFPALRAARLPVANAAGRVAASATTGVSVSLGVWPGRS
jgi:hypothetical protein